MRVKTVIYAGNWTAAYRPPSASAGPATRTPPGGTAGRFRDAQRDHVHADVLVPGRQVGIALHTDGVGARVHTQKRPESSTVAGADLKRQSAPCRCAVIRPRHSTAHPGCRMAALRSPLRSDGRGRFIMAVSPWLPAVRAYRQSLSLIGGPAHTHQQYQHTGSDISHQFKVISGPKQEFYGADLAAYSSLVPLLVRKVRGSFL